MVVTVADLLNCLDDLAPFAMAESWDNVGLLIGDRTRAVSSILIGLDPTNRLLGEALELGADTVITHHPAIFKPIPAINTAEPSGRFLETALGGRLNVIACHTNFDSAAHGLNDRLAEMLGLTEVKPLLPSATHPAEGAGMGRIGLFPKPVSRTDFIEKLLDIFELPCLQIAGRVPESVFSVALCGGSGSDFAETAKKCGADVYISSEIKHNIARWAEEADFCVIDGTHYATEKLAVQLLAERLRTYAYERSWQVSISETTTEKHPYTYITKESYR